MHKGSGMGNTTENQQSSDKETTFIHEESLPKVPLPDLGETQERFMEWCSPLLNSEEAQKTQAALKMLTSKGGLGERLHAALVDFNNQPTTHSWLDIFWPSRYLGRRDPIALNANFFFLFRHEHLGQLQRAAKIAASALNYKLMLDDEKIPVAKIKNTPLSMDQVKYLFSATRIPGEKQDTLRSSYSTESPGPSTARHCLVCHNGRFFALDLISNEGTAHSFNDITAGLFAIVEASTEKDNDHSIGHFTTMPRAEWAKTRKALLEVNADNRAALDSIETALFVINLDEANPQTELEACDDLLHGGPGNRYYDKALQLIIFKNGWAGINIEHCGLDGTTILNFVDYILSCKASDLDARNKAVSKGTPSFNELTFTLTPELENKLQKAAVDFQALRKTTITRTYDLPEWGGAHIKSLGMSPDAFAQCAMQLAHKRTKGFIGATYESIATRQYRRGRTEAMRTVTPEVFNFVETMENPSTSLEEKISSFRAAADRHVARAKDCQKGNAPEQHLWELQNIYNRNPEEFISNPGFFARLFGARGLTKEDCKTALEFYESPGWIKLRSDSLSTSSAPSPTIQYFGFGSTGPGCIGIGYLVRNDVINCYLATAQGEEAALSNFITQYDKALRELAALLEHTKGREQPS